MTTLDVATEGEGPFVAGEDKSRRAMNWLFANKSRMFWILQTTGWLSFFVFHVLIVSSLVEGWSQASVAYSASSTVTGFLTTAIILRPLFRFARRQPPLALVLIAVFGALALSFAVSAVKALMFKEIFGDAWLLTRIQQLGTDNLLLLLQPDVPPNFFLLMSWGGFYFGVNFYLTLRGEAERALLAARLAEQTQLKMLRYQLNPHFLFNTLNAISTLVLTKDGRQANEMLTKLSAFLRYSLDSDPLQTTTLAEELRALQLYLDIETTRFGDRLRIITDVDRDVLDARVPSLILQPAIENAIKYAIARMESGGEIAIVAKREDDMLRLEVCDNGPDAPENPERLLREPSADAGDAALSPAIGPALGSSLGPGLGLINMRDRLVHLYGAAQSFSLSHRAPTGLRVTMKLPLDMGRSAR